MCLFIFVCECVCVCLHVCVMMCMAISLTTSTILWRCHHFREIVLFFYLFLVSLGSSKIKSRSAESERFFSLEPPGSPRPQAPGFQRVPGRKISQILCCGTSLFHFTTFIKAKMIFSCFLIDFFRNACIKLIKHCMLLGCTSILFYY